MEDPINTKEETPTQCSKWCRPSDDKRTRWIQLFVVMGVLVAINLGVSAGVATSNNNDWLDTLNNPPFRPPGWLFAPVCILFPSIFVCLYYSPPHIFVPLIFVTQTKNFTHISTQNSKILFTSVSLNSKGLKFAHSNSYAPFRYVKVCQGMSSAGSLEKVSLIDLIRVKPRVAYGIAKNEIDKVMIFESLGLGRSKIGLIIAMQILFYLDGS